MKVKETIKINEEVTRQQFTNTRDMVSYFIKELQVLSSDLKRLNNEDVTPSDVANDIDIILKPFNRS